MLLQVRYGKGRSGKTSFLKNIKIIIRTESLNFDFCDLDEKGWQDQL